MELYISSSNIIFTESLQIRRSFFGILNNGRASVVRMIGHWDRVVLVIAELIAVGVIIVFSGRFVVQADKRSSLFKTALALFVLIYGGTGIGCTSRNTVGGENAVGATNHTAASRVMKNRQSIRRRR